MTNQMNALVLTDYRKLELKRVPRPVIIPGEVLIRVKAAAICGSDVHGYDGSTGRRIPPIIMGHEAAGVIEQITEGSAYRVGERVTFDSTIYCGVCFYCRSGLPNLCDNRKIIGVSCEDYRREGTFAEYIAVPERVLYRLPDNVDFNQAALTEPLSIAFHAINLTPIRLGDTVLVIGAGTIGQLLIRLLKQSNAGRIIASEPDLFKQQMAKKSGADVCVGSARDLNEAVIRETSGRGVDVVFEAVGLGETVGQAIEQVRKDGQVTLVGNIKPEVPLALQKVIGKQVTIRGSAASCGEYDRCLDMISGQKFSVADMISATAPLAAGGDWFARLYRAEKGLLKVILNP